MGFNSAFKVLKVSRQNVKLAEAIFIGGFARSKHIPILCFSRDV
jgi:hypothetical protein